MARSEHRRLTRREQEIMDIIHRLGEATVADLIAHLSSAPTDGAVRRMLNLLVAKGAIEYRHDGPKKAYRAREATRVAGERALRRVVDTFFAGSAARTVAALFGGTGVRLDDDERSALRKLIRQAKDKGR